VASVALHPSPTTSPAPRGRGGARWLAYFAPVGLGLALAAWPRASADRPGDATLEAKGGRLAGAIERARGSTVALEYGPRDASGRRRVATGVVINDRGEVLSIRVDPPTGRDPSVIVARDAAGHRHPARWVANDPETGLSLLRIEADDIRPVRPAAREAELGADVLVIGNPYGLGHSVGRGSVAGLDRRVEIGRRLEIGGLIQLQVPLHPGDSGALLTDLDGAWLGLVWGGLAFPGVEPARGDDDLGFAIPARDALWVADQLRDRKKVDRAYLGVRLAPVDAEEGVKVNEALPQSPAALAGLRPGDRIVRVDGQPVRTADDLTDRLDRTLAGAEIALERLRPAGRETLKIRVAARPAEARPVDPARASPRETLLDRVDRLQRRVDELERRDRDRSAGSP